MDSKAKEILRVTCPHCGKSLKAPATMAGKKGKCQNCQTVIVISAEPEDTAQQECSNVGSMSDLLDEALNERSNSPPNSSSQGGSVAVKDEDAFAECPRCDGKLMREWNVCPHCDLLMTLGVCSICGKRHTSKKRCRCGVPIVVVVKDTQRALCTNCGRSIPWKPAQCVRCAIDYHVYENPYSSRSNSRGPRENFTDEKRIRIFRIVIRDVQDAMAEKKMRKGLNFARGALTAGVVGKGFAAGAWSVREQQIDSEYHPVNIRELHRLLKHLHRQTDYKYATRLERFTNIL